MAKMFYTMEEAKTALGRTEDEIKTLTREGKLREFRDGPRLMFKADQVDALKGSLPPKDTIDIADSGAPISLVDSKGGSAAGGSRAGSAPGAMSIKDDTAMGDIGIGGSRAGSRAGSASGINIFNADDSETVDPSAATAITPASESANLEAVGSGSGLLDLTRESDDTSLGAVLDEIQPGKRDPGGSRAGSGSVAAAAISSTGPVRVAPVVVYRADASAPFFGGLALGGVVIALIALLILSGAVNGTQLALAKSLANMGFLIMLGVFLGISVVCGIIGFGIGKVLK